MKGTEHFEKTILAHLEQLSIENQELKLSLSREDKSITDCVTYILNTVQKSGFNGFCDNEIFGMAQEYYLHDNVEIGEPIQSQIVINRIPELTVEEKEAAKQKAFADLVSQEKQKITKKSTSKSSKESLTPTLF